jgi:AraC family ethanolamine operon transcriptional activator
MPGSVTSVFSEAADFETALRDEGCLSLLVTGPGPFRARLTQITLYSLHLVGTEEELPRVGFVQVPADDVLVTLPLGETPAPFWGVMETRPADIITLGPGQRVHSRTDGPCHWAAIRLPAENLAQYGGALSGAVFAVPPVARWRPPRAALRQLRHFHQAAVRRANARSGVLADREAAHGLEQQVIHALVESLSAEPVYQETEAARRHRGMLARFEDLLEAEPPPSVSAIGAALGVSERVLRECCKKNLGMDPSRYRRLRGMQRVHRTLRREHPDTAAVSEVARRYGFRSLGSFGANYRALYGESPSATLHAHYRMADHTLRSRP